MRVLKTNQFALSLLMVLPSTYALSSGMAVPVYSTDAASTANANAAEAENPETIVGNPAGIAYLDGTILENNLFIVQPRFKYKDAKAYFYYKDYPVPGSTSGEIGHRMEVPGIFFSHRLNEKVAVGAALYAPFGADFAYSMDSVMRYSGNRAKIISVIFNPTIAFKINPKHSIGIGIFAIHSKSKFRQFADVSYGINNFVNRVLPILRGKEILHGGEFEGYVDIKGDAWKIGGNIGWLWDINDEVRVGISYRTKTTIHSKADAYWKKMGYGWGVPVADPVVDHIYRKIGFIPHEKMKYTMHFPELWQIHGRWVVNDRLKLFGNIGYSKDSRQKALHVDWGVPKMSPDSNSPTPNFVYRDFTEIAINFQDTWRTGIGGSYQYSEPLQLRAGIMYAKSAVKGPGDRYPITPDGNRLMLGLGGNYKYNKNLTLGFSYNFLKLGKAEIDSANYCGNKLAAGPGSVICVDSRVRSTGRVKSSAHIVGTSFKYRF